MKELNHSSIHAHRLAYDNFWEQAFADIWQKECESGKGRDYGQGTLQDLLAIAHNPSKPHGPAGMCFPPNYAFKHIINQRDAEIVATVIQWLGSNCGSGFLQEVEDKAKLLINENREQLAKGAKRK